MTVAVVGASIGWVAGDRAARRAKAAESFDGAVQQAITFMQQERWPDAKAAAQRAAGLLAGAGGDQLQQKRLKQVEADLYMATGLEFARLQKASRGRRASYQLMMDNQLYQAAFLAYNLPVLELEPDEAARRIDASTIRDLLVAALVDWIRNPTDVGELKKLTTLRRLADRNPWRRHVWDALDHHDEPSLLRLAQSKEALGQPPACLVAFAGTLERIDKSAAVAFLRQAQQRHPDDFWINHDLAVNLMRIEPPQLEDAIGYFRAAVAVRPESPGAHLNLGNALHNKGRLDEAIAEFREAIRIENDFVVPHINLGKALADKGRLDEAIAEYGFAAAHIDFDNAADKRQWDEAIAEYREAIRLKKDSALARNYLRQFEQMSRVADRLPRVLEGKDQPKDAAECLAFAQLCGRYKMLLFAAAARFYGEAFATESNLADDLNTQHRYDAACAAALAGRGKGKGADKLDGKERARLRQQALDWLRADLKAYRQLMEKSAGKAGPTVAQRMQHWLQDTDFAGVRGDKALAKLPEAERQEWQKLWEEVEALRQRAAQQPKTASSARP